jgi:cytochrome c oxidase subunit III
LSWFWACFAPEPAPAELIGGAWPKSIGSGRSWHLPLFASLILLASAAAVTAAHQALLNDDRAGLRRGLVVAIVLGLGFVALQALASSGGAFDVPRNLCGAIVFMATGYHGFLVLAGVAVLVMCLIVSGRFTAKRSRGVEAVAWLWHLVDAAWLVLFAGSFVWAVGAGG